MAVAEFLVEDAVVEGKFRHGAGGFSHQLALDRHRGALLAGKAAELVACGVGELLLFEAALCLSCALAPSSLGLAVAAAGLRALPARRRIARPKGFHVVEARGAVAACAAPGTAALGFGDLDAPRRQLIEEA